MESRFIMNPAEEIIREVELWFGFFDGDPIRLDIDEFHHLISGTRNVIFVEGYGDGINRVGNAFDTALVEAMRIAPNFDIMSAERFLFQICDSVGNPMKMDEMISLQTFLNQLDFNADVAWGLSHRESGEGVLIKIAATNLSRK